ncbi:hypothetical protein, partial [Microseira wollei]|uniref:hypothetical protein n=1 Tax=Microseira wollei TaxID=467598 RepID=UPI001CFDF185
ASGIFVLNASIFYAVPLPRSLIWSLLIAASGHGVRNFCFKRLDLLCRAPTTIVDLVVVDRGVGARRQEFLF